MKDRLTKRERLLMQYMMRGNTAKETADAFGINEQTIKNYRHSLYNKLGARNAPHAVAIFLQRQKELL